MEIKFKQTEKDYLIYLFYEFYKNILHRFETKPPKLYITEAYKYSESKNGYSFQPFLKANIFTSYSGEIEKVINNMPSFVNIISFIKSHQEIFNKPATDSNDSSSKNNLGTTEEYIKQYGYLIYLIIEKLFKRYNPPKPIVYYRWNKVAILKNEFNIPLEDIINCLNKKEFQIKEYRYLFENALLEISDLEEISLNNELHLVKLNEKEKNHILNSNNVFNVEIRRIIQNINVVLCSKKKLTKKELRKIFTILRLFKKGDFRIFAETVSIVDKISNEKIYQILPVDDWIGNQLFITKNWPTFTNGLIISKNEIESLIFFFKNVYPKLSHSKFNFSIKCLCQIHSNEPDFKIPFLFFILESFFDNIKQEQTYRLKNLITKILGKSYQYSGNIKKFYELRSKIVHGDAKGIEKTLTKIYKSDKEKCKDLFDCADTLEDVMRKVWKKILLEDLFEDGVDIESKYF